MSVQMDTTNAQDSSDEFSSDSEYANLSGEEWQKVSIGGTKRKKDARRTATPRKRVVQKTTPPSSPSSHPPANSPAGFSPKVLVINAPQWKGEFPVMIALSTEYPALKILTKRGLTRTLIRAKDQASQDSLLNITSLQQKPVSFTPLPDTKATRYGIVQRVPLAVPTALLRAITPLVLEADRMSVWNSTAKAAQPTMSIKIKYEGSLPASLEIGHLGSFSVRPFTPDPIRCYRCQRFGHTTRTCHQETSTCGICSGAHRTTVCQQNAKQKQSRHDAATAKGSIQHLRKLAQSGSYVLRHWLQNSAAPRKPQQQQNKPNHPAKTFVQQWPTSRKPGKHNTPNNLSQRHQQRLPQYQRRR